MQRKPLSGLVSLRIDRRASQTIGGGGEEPGRRPSDPKSGSVLFGRICFRFREHDLIRSLIGFRHSSRSGIDSPSEQIEQIDDGNGVERFEDRKAHRIVSLRFDFDFRIRKSPLYSRFNAADSTGTFVSNVTLAREPQKTVAHDENMTTAATFKEKHRLGRRFSQQRRYPQYS